MLYRNARPLFQPALGGPPQFFEEDGAAAVVCAVNDLVLLVAGTDECDALLSKPVFCGFGVGGLEYRGSR